MASFAPAGDARPAARFLPLPPSLLERMPLRRPVLMTAGVLAAYWLLLVLATHLPVRAAANGSGLGLDKFVHFTAYAGLAGLGYLLAAAVWRPGVWLVFGVILAAAVHAVLDEWTQGFVPHRSPDWRDGVSDVAGAVAGVATAAAARRLLAWRTERVSETLPP